MTWRKVQEVNHIVAKLSVKIFHLVNPISGGMVGHEPQIYCGLEHRQRTALNMRLSVHISRNAFWQTFVQSFQWMLLISNHATKTNDIYLLWLYWE